MILISLIYFSDGDERLGCVSELPGEVSDAERGHEGVKVLRGRHLVLAGDAHLGRFQEKKFSVLGIRKSTIGKSGKLIWNVLAAVNILVHSPLVIRKLSPRWPFELDEEPAFSRN